MSLGRSVTPVEYLFGVCPVETCSVPVVECLLKASPCLEISQPYPRWLPEHMQYLLKRTCDLASPSHPYFLQRHPTDICCS